MSWKKKGPEVNPSPDWKPCGGRGVKPLPTQLFDYA